MSHEQVGRLVDKWMNDQEFRKQLKANPQEAIKKSGVSLAPEEWAALKKIDWNKSDQELQALISKPTL